MTDLPKPPPRRSPRPVRRSRARRMKRSTVVGLGITGLLAGGLTAGAIRAGTSGPDYSAVCVNQQQQRVEDRQCDNAVGGGSGPYGWYFLGRGSYAPPIGQGVNGGTFSVPSGSSFKQGGIDPAGGQVARGGFGSRAGGIGG